MQDHASTGKRDVNHQHTPSEDIRTRRGASRNTIAAHEPVEIDLVAAVLAMLDDEPVALLASIGAAGEAAHRTLPFHAFSPSNGSSLDTAARQSLFHAGNIEPGHIEQLSSYAYGRQGTGVQSCALAIGYLALVRADQLSHIPRVNWLRIYDLLPWEDWRRGRPACLAEIIEPALNTWQRERTDADPDWLTAWTARVRIAFGLDQSTWDDERVAERLEILEETGVLSDVSPIAMDSTHRRILAAGIGRLRARLRHRPVVFEMLPQQFTLFELQRAVEAILGPHLHKQNFRRLVEGMGLVEPTGEVRSHTGGRPARLFRFRPAVMLERPAPGMRIRPGKAA